MKDFIKNFSSGITSEAYKYLGSFLNGDAAVFRVWAPNAANVSVVGDFNNWDSKANPMKKTDGGIWQANIKGLKQYDNYKYAVTGGDGMTVLKSDPYARHYETAPANASKIYSSDYSWNDLNWRESQKKKSICESPVNIYEVHAGSWRRFEDGNVYDYVTLARELSQYLKKMNYTHVELMPITEYPFEGSWGYQVSGYFAPTSRYGTPDDFKKFIDIMHENGIGVILDWVPAHFPRDGFGLFRFDGTPCYEYADPRKGEHKEWGTVVFDYGKPQVRNFLISSAVYWIKEYHIDGLRVDAVASMLYLDYGRQGGDWIPNSYGGRENLEAVAFLKDVNSRAFAANPSVMMIAEESTAWPLVTKPPQDGGLGFNFKWNMGWMNDILNFYQMDPLFRKYHFNLTTFSFMYRMSENFILPLSHDEVVHGKRSLMNKMFGPRDKQFAQLRNLLTLQMTYPGKKLLFMGSEFGQYLEWRYNEALDWAELNDELNSKMQYFDQKLNEFYLNEPSLWQLEQKDESVQIIDADNKDESVLTFIRQGKIRHDFVIVILNFTPVERKHFSIGVPYSGKYQEAFNTARKEFGGTWDKDVQTMTTKQEKFKNLDYQIELDLPGFSAMILKPLDAHIKRGNRRKK